MHATETSLASLLLGCKYGIIITIKTGYSSSNGQVQPSSTSDAAHFPADRIIPPYTSSAKRPAKKNPASPDFHNSFQTTIGKQSEAKRPIGEHATTPPTHSITLDPSSATVLAQRQRKQCRAEIQHNLMFTTKPREVKRFATYYPNSGNFFPRRTVICNELRKSRPELHGSQQES